MVSHRAQCCPHVSSMFTSMTFHQHVHENSSMLTIYVWQLKHTFGEVEDILNRDLEKMATFFGRWRLQPSFFKTVCCVFHLRNARANQKLNHLLSGQQIRHEPNQVYLGVTMDRSLTFRSHLKVCSETRNNLLSKLAGSSWGALNDRLPLHKDITSHPVSQLPSRRPIWQEEWSKKFSTPSQWLEEWLSADTLNGSLVADPSIQVPGFDLPRRLWCTPNRFRTGQGRCAASLTRWQQITDPTCCDWRTTTNDDAYC